MAYIRTTTFSLRRDEAEVIKPGEQVYNVLVAARKFLAQSLDGLVQTALWRSTNASGRVQFVIMTEWATLEDMQEYVNNPTIQEMEKLLDNEGFPLSIWIYEAIG